MGTNETIIPSVTSWLTPILERVRRVLGRAIARNSDYFSIRVSQLNSG